LGDVAITGLHVVVPGERIVAESGFLRGHGTRVDGGGDGDGDDTAAQQQPERLAASVSGVVERVSKLISVRAMRGRYVPEVGDVVVGRVVEVGQGRWRVDIGARGDATLMLSAVNLPGGVQRKRTYEDELNMRTHLAEGDLISAEVQAVTGDGTAQLHTRSARYGKLVQGTLVEVPAALVRRCKSHFFACEFGVSFIFGTNGFVWVYPSAIDAAAAPATTTAPLADATADALPSSSSSAPSPVPVNAEMRNRMARVRNCFLALSAHGVAIYPPTVLTAYQSSEVAGVPAKEMLRPEIAELVAAKAREVAQL
jgi:exosome complex component RRP4